MKRRKPSKKETPVPEPSAPLSKHAKRRLRREQYYCMLDGQLIHERHFMGRVVDVLNHKGIDCAHDGHLIKANWWNYMATRESGRRVNAFACLYLLDRTFRNIRPAIHTNYIR